ncbi:MAG: 2-oxo acid dehydrogenase subunit E2, partial [Planctomycetes bacterium]|nr:2-oxo acid dehydrogenase subunit E2 [Planctomycetota bacterium]
MEFRLPELGEGISDATVVNVAVKMGDAVTAGQTLLEVETDKAAMPVPAIAAGTIVEVRVKPGDKIKIGHVLMVLTSATGATRKPAPEQPAPRKAAAEKPAASTPTPAPVQAASSPTSKIEFALPALGEGIEGGTIVSVTIARGDTVKKEQELFTIETDKASVPVPSPYDGVIEELRIKPGDKINVGAVVVVFSTSQRAPSKAGTPTAAPRSVATPEPVAATATATMPAQVASETANGSSTTATPAGPATRRLARELGINLQDIPGSARGGRVTIDDIKTFVRKKITQPAPAKGSSGFVIPPLPDFSKYGPVESKPVSNIRKKIAENLSLSWHVAPAVTQFDLADITELEAGRKRISDGLVKGSPKITMTVLAVKAVVSALKEFANFNSSLDMANGVQIFKQYYHVGIAVDTERGLVVPVIRDADKKSIRDLAKDIADLAEKARNNKLTIDEMRGGSFTITNLGGIGGTAFTPIINYPEVAILGMARSSWQPVVR